MVSSFLYYLPALEDVLQRVKHSGVFFRQADGDPQHVAFDVTDNDPLTEQSIKDLSPVATDVEIEKVGFAGEGLEAECDEACSDPRYLGLIHGPALRHMLLVSQRRQGGLLGQTVGVERRTDAV